MKRQLILSALVAAAVSSCRPASEPTYLYLWAGDSAGTASDFLAVINATPGSPEYGKVVTSLPVGATGTHPHHTEAAMPSGGHLLANGFAAGRTWLFDLTQPTQPKILTHFDNLAGFSHPHTYWRLADGNVLATFQYAADSVTGMTGMRGMTGMTGMAGGGTQHRTGGLVQMDERGTVIRSASARDTTISDRGIYPYSALPIPSLDRIVSTTTDMDDMDTVATARWIQLWRLSDLKLLKSFALEPGPRGNENRWTGEPRLLPDGRSVYIHTFMCGLYLLRGVESDTPHATLVHTFEGKNCGVPVLTGHWWLATVPDAHALVALDISDPEHPRQVSSLSFGENEAPHWIAIDSAGHRVVLNSGGGGTGNRLFVVNFDPATGALTMDTDFHDAGDSLPGIKLTGRVWPHGLSRRAQPHGTVFSR